MVQSPATPRAVSAARSREALIDAALSRFARDGFDATATDRIAEDAGVSPRTFFRYFPTKESVVFHRDYGFMRSFASAFLEQPSTRSDYEALRATFVALAAGFAALRERIQTYRAAVDSSPVLLGREQEHFADHARTISGAIARRRGVSEPDGDAATLAAVALALYQRALRRWLDGPRTRELGDLVDEEFRRLRRLVG
ncbi:MAG TPA: TetR family transcriptional regulator [Acidimicrobiia bacterium]|jgi:AcrR family transcriptional regulator|nr:TetR family transcriptional regulator [Acidimicrobiia bacterium]